MATRTGPLPQPDALRNARIAAAAIREAAEAMPRNLPEAARLLKARANLILTAAQEQAQRDRASLDARGCWVRKPFKSGPLEGYGPAHIATPYPALITDPQQSILCGQGTLSSRRLSFGPRAQVGEPAPEGWRECVACVLAFARAHHTDRPAVALVAAAAS